VTIWCPVMFNGELDMLEFRLGELEPYGDVRTVLVEAARTHRGVPKPLVYEQNKDRFAKWNDSIVHVVADLPDAPPWTREHAQRGAAWPVIDAAAGPQDSVLITDLDEIPSPSLMDWPKATGYRYSVVAARMRTTLFAVDWEVPDAILPPTCVAATVSYLRLQAAKGKGLGEVRDGRGGYPVLKDGGWHFSWIGGPQAQRRKLEISTCHTELIGTREGDLIADGTRWRTGEHGEGHLPVTPVDVDGSWPAAIREKRVPAEWYRPR
jgi:hypothetical protein